MKLLQQILDYKMSNLRGIAIAYVSVYVVYIISIMISQNLYLIFGWAVFQTIIEIF